MKRDAMLLYLSNIRDLEVANELINRHWDTERKNYQKEKQALENVKFKSIPEFNGTSPKVWKRNILFSRICLFVVFPFLFVALMWYMISTDSTLGLPDFFPIFFVWFFFFVELLGIITISQKSGQLKDYNKSRDSVIEYNTEQQRIKDKNAIPLQRLNDNWNKRNKFWEGEHNKVNTILDDLYEMNIIPLQFRHSLACVCYIYDYMSSSQASLTETLYHTHMEDGIQRIERKLDLIIVQLKDMIYETRCVAQKADQIIQQNKSMLETERHTLLSQQRTEENTLEAAQYAKLSADYDQAVAFFAWADYIKN